MNSTPNDEELSFLCLPKEKKQKKGGRAAETTTVAKMRNRRGKNSQRSNS